MQRARLNDGVTVGFVNNLRLFNFRHQESSDFSSFIKSIPYFFQSGTFARIAEFHSKVGDSFYKNLKFLKSRVLFFTVNNERGQVVYLSKLFTLHD